MVLLVQLIFFLILWRNLYYNYHNNIDQIILHIISSLLFCLCCFFCDCLFFSIYLCLFSILSSMTGFFFSFVNHSTPLLLVLLCVLSVWWIIFEQSKCKLLRLGAFKVFGESIGDVVLGRNMLYMNLPLFTTVSDVVVAHLYVFHLAC